MDELGESEEDCSLEFIRVLKDNNLRNFGIITTLFTETKDVLISREVKRVHQVSDSESREMYRGANNLALEGEAVRILARLNPDEILASCYSTQRIKRPDSLGYLIDYLIANGRIPESWERITLVNEESTATVPAEASALLHGIEKALKETPVTPNLMQLVKMARQECKEDLGIHPVLVYAVKQGYIRLSGLISILNSMAYAPHSKEGDNGIRFVQGFYLKREGRLPFPRHTQPGRIKGLDAAVQAAVLDSFCSPYVQSRAENSETGKYYDPDYRQGYTSGIAELFKERKKRFHELERTKK